MPIAKAHEILEKIDDVHATDQRSKQSRTTSGSPGNDRRAPPLPAGNKPGVVRGLPEPGDRKSDDGKHQSGAGDPSQNPKRPVHRVTGTADVPLTPIGEKQAEAAADDIKAQNVRVFSSPSTRAEETAAYIDSDPQAEDWLRPWGHGKEEGQTVKESADAIKDRVENPDKSPGISPISGEKGDTLNEFRLRFLPGLRKQIMSRKPSETLIDVVSGSNLQMTRAWMAKGMPKSFEIDPKVMMKEYHEAPGDKLFMDIHTRKLVPIEKISKPGIYFVHHAATPFNPPK